MLVFGQRILCLTRKLQFKDAETTYRWFSTHKQACAVISGTQYTEKHRVGFLNGQQPLQRCQAREVGFFSRLTGDRLWDGVTGVSNAGRKRGRGKRVGRKRMMDLNKGQKLGTGKANIMWPGLNAPVQQGRERYEIKQLPPNPNYVTDLVKLRESAGRITHRAPPPLLRGWSGNRVPGQSAGPPDPIEDYKFEGFDSRVLQTRFVSNMTGTLGKKYRHSAFVVVGNKNGLAGYGMGKAVMAKTAIRVAKNRAAQNLMFIPRYENHTVYHNMFSQHHKSKIFIHKRERGYGLKCHRAIKTICELMGIEDLHVKVEGSTSNIHALSKGFFHALANQETFDALADRMKLHVVEKRPERAYYPQVIASPSSGETRKTPVLHDNKDPQLEWLYYDGKTEYKKPRKQPFFSKLNSYKMKCRWEHKVRNQPKAQILRRAGLW